MKALLELERLGYRFILNDPNVAETEYEVICLNCLAVKRAELHARIMQEYEDKSLLSLRYKSLELLEKILKPIWVGKPLKIKDIINVVRDTKNANISYDRKTLYRYLAYLEAGGYITAERDPLDLRRKLYRITKTED